MRVLRALLVDDEEPARDRLRRMLAGVDGVEVVGEAADGTEALERIHEDRPDLVFLDIEMPGLTGIEVAKRLAPPRPRIVYCTAYDRYAVQAFDEDVEDYLLKPVSLHRLTRSLERVRRTVDEDDRLRREFADAGRTQARLYPRDLPALHRLEFAGRCLPAHEVGGDYYDFLPLGDGRLGIALGDVSGKGLDAGLLMAGLQARLQSLAPRFGLRLDELISELNRSLVASVESHRYATLFYGVFDDTSRELVYVNAGHPWPLVVQSDGPAPAETAVLESSGTVIGLLPDGAWTACRRVLRPGDVLCAFSDGVTEATDPEGVEFGSARLADVLARDATLSAERLCQAVLDEVARFSRGAAPTDDRTVVVARAR